MLQIINTSQRGENEVMANSYCIVSVIPLYVIISTVYLPNLELHPIIKTYATLEILFIFYSVFSIKGLKKSQLD